MSLTDLPHLSVPPRNQLPISEENAKPHVQLPVNHDCQITFKGPLHDRSADVDSTEDSVAMRRRHAVYMPRPPVWRPSPSSHERLFPVLGGEDISGPFSEIDIDGHVEIDTHDTARLDALPSCFTQDTPDIALGQIPEEQVNFEQQFLCDIAAVVNDAGTTGADESGSDPEIPLFSPFSEPTRRRCDWSQHGLLNSPCSSSDNSSTRGLHVEPFRQAKVGLCTRLRSYRDIRLGIGEKWAIQEGSLVVCIGPQYTSFHPQKEHLLDEFELVPGDLYIVCNLYADMWALCIKMSFDSRTESETEQSLDRCSAVGFIPLCAVTLAVNYSSFLRRCVGPIDGPLTYTGNGLLTIPPGRSHSINASKQIFQGNGLDVGLPVSVYDACNTLSIEGINVDFIPLDSSLEQLFSDLGARRDRVHQIKKRMSLRRLWHGAKTPESQSPDGQLNQRERHSFSFRDLSSGPQGVRIGSQLQAPGHMS